MPVSPSDRHGVSALPAASHPPTAKSMSASRSPASCSAAAHRHLGHLQARHALVTPERVDPHPDDRDAHEACTGLNAYVTAPLPPGAGTSTSSIGMPMCKRSGSASVSRASTRTSPGSST